MLIPPLIVVRGAEGVVCGIDSNLDSWLTRDVMRSSSSFIIRDPDGSLWNAHAGTFNDNKFALNVLNLSNIKSSSRYNPFRYVADDYGIHNFAAAIMNGTKGKGKPGDIRFLSGETKLLSALISHIHYEAPDYELDIKMLLTILEYMMPEDYEEGHITAVDLVFEDLARNVPGHKAAQLYHDFKAAVGEDAIHIAASCAARLAPLNTPEMLDFMSDDELRLDYLYIPKTALFVYGTPKKGCEFLTPLIYSQLFDALNRNRV
jgi:type IV secretion system protein VirD4